MIAYCRDFSYHANNSPRLATAGSVDAGLNMSGRASERAAVLLLLPMLPFTTATSGSQSLPVAAGSNDFSSSGLMAGSVMKRM